MVPNSTEIASGRAQAGASPRFLTPDGQLVTIDAPGYDLRDPWFASIRIRTQRPYAGLPTGLELRELHLAPAGNYDRVIEHVLHGHVVERIEAQGGHFLIAHSKTDDRGLALWRGRWHEAATWLPAVASLPRSSALRYFDRLVFTDSPLGLKVQTRSPSSEHVEIIEVSKRIPEVGFLDIKKAESAVGLVPKWAGARVRTGEVWRKETFATLDGVASHVLVHATPTTVTVLTGEGKDKHLEVSRLDFLDSLIELNWSS